MRLPAVGVHVLAQRRVEFEQKLVQNEGMDYEGPFGPENVDGASFHKQ